MQPLGSRSAGTRRTSSFVRACARCNRLRGASRGGQVAKANRKGSAVAADPFLTVWGLFRALETAGEELHDPTVDDLYEDAIKEIGS
jgi:hypothetical protein